MNLIKGHAKAGVFQRNIPPLKIKIDDGDVTQVSVLKMLGGVLKR